MVALRFPLNYVGITSGFRTSSRPNHTGIDLGWNNNYGGQNADVFAPANGKVIQVVDGRNNNKKDSNDAGNVVKIQHQDGLITRVIHLLNGSIKVKVGDIVYQGQHIAKMNNSGYSFGSHIHYDVWLNGTKVNPLDYTYIFDGQTIAPSTQKEYAGRVKSVKDIVTPSNGVYVVKKGDNLSKIASMHNTTYQELAKYNNISNPNKINVGQKINIPTVNTKFNLTRLIRKNSKGNDVKELQKRLRELNYNIGKYGADGIAGNDTINAVKRFQRNNGLIADGIVGLRTANSLGWTYQGK